MEEVLTMTPPPFSFIQPNTGWVTAYMLLRLTAITASQSASLNLRNDLSRRIPALLIRISARLKCSSAVANKV
ncbi:hypothetical protein D3C72_2071690 [compost metagenome]